MSGQSQAGETGTASRDTALPPVNEKASPAGPAFRICYSAWRRYRDVSFSYHPQPIN
jgi:hypothetical protein